MSENKTFIVPSWVHSLDDYKSMFALTEQDLSKKLVDYPAGISCFNAELFAKGHTNIVSADACYDLSPMDMVKHVDYVIQNLSENLEHYIQHLHTNGEKETENLLNVWNQYAQTFLVDYSDGQHQGRYQAAHLPRLPFSDGEFELALCSDMVFRESTIAFQDVIFELCRVAHEVRIFPLLNQFGDIAEELGPVMLTLQENNLGVEVKEVPYQLQKKSNAMLRIWVKACVVD